MSGTTYYFAIVGANDSPVYENEFGVSRPDARHMHQFVVHGALDPVEDALFKTTNCYLKTVDRFNEWNVSAYVTPSNTRLMLLHDTTQSEEAIRMFFVECHELYLKQILNPFFDPSSQQILSQAFGAKVTGLAKKYLL
ncbi:TRAPP subunit [Coemansia sp. RSA 552]|nr:TRAPP subunit [Coemansia sp. RSA 552]